MTTRPKQRCVLCKKLSAGLYCDSCKPKRESPQARGYDNEWRKVREYKLAIDPVCEECAKDGRRPIPATDVHHIKPIRTHPHLRLTLSNLSSLCRPCHNRIERARMQMQHWERRSD